MKAALVEFLPSGYCYVVCPVCRDRLPVPLAQLGGFTCGETNCARCNQLRSYVLPKLSSVRGSGEEL
jgi:hypothetical protein